METPHRFPKGNYTKEELGNKRVNELKEILKNLNLSTSGKKIDLVNRILTSQQTYLELLSKSVPIYEGSDYFSLLPKDILNIVEKYQIENDINRKILEYLLYDNLTAPKILTGKNKKVLENIFKKYNLDISILPQQGNTPFVFQWGNVKIVPDDVIRELFPIFCKASPWVTEKLIEFGSKFRWVSIITPRIQGKHKYFYELVEIARSIEMVEDK